VTLSRRAVFVAASGMVFCGCAGGAPNAREAPSAKRTPELVEAPFFQARGSRRIAITVDDGYDAGTLAAYVALCEETGIHLTFCPVGSMSRNWEPVASRISSLVERRQVQIVNHTFSHQDQTTLTADQVHEDLGRNDEWITATFGTDARPYWRPPYGAYDLRTQQIAADLGYTRTLLWGSSFEDSALLTRHELMKAARAALYPGVVVLAHANHPTVTTLYPRITALIRQRRLDPSTVDELFGSSPPPAAGSSGSQT